METEARNRAAYLLTTMDGAGNDGSGTNGACDCGCNEWPKAYSDDDTHSVPCEPVPDCNW